MAFHGAAFFSADPTEEIWALGTSKLSCKVYYRQALEGSQLKNTFDSCQQVVFETRIFGVHREIRGVLQGSRIS